MLTIEHLSQKTKDRMINILDQDGVNYDSVQACIVGFSCENLGITSFEESIQNRNEIEADIKVNNKAYAEQILTIYGNHCADLHIVELNARFGVDPKSELAKTIESKKAGIVKRLAEEWIPKVTNKS